jgi:pimeloyl-ACP methyl ester carboxylesterase
VNQDQIELLDTHGNGNQSHLPSFVSIADNVRDLRARSRLAQDGPVHLLTLSMSSMMALEWAHLFPGELASITIMNTSDGRLSGPHERLNIKNYRNILKSLRSIRDPFEFEMSLLEVIAQNVQDKEAVARAFAKEPTTSVGNLTRQLLAASTFRLPKERPEIPILILGGRQDRFVNPVCTERIAKELDLPVAWHETAGHDIPLEFPDWVSEKVYDFVTHL